jgi:hypothetical protein
MAERKRHELKLTALPGGRANGWEPMAWMECSCGEMVEVDEMSVADVAWLERLHLATVAIKAHTYVTVDGEAAHAPDEETCAICGGDADHADVIETLTGARPTGTDGVYAYESEYRREREGRWTLERCPGMYRAGAISARCELPVGHKSDHAFRLA